MDGNEEILGTPSSDGVGVAVDDRERWVEYGKRGGRPVGSSETPQVVLRREMVASGKMLKSMREVIERELGKVGVELEREGLGLEARLGVMGQLVVMMQGVGRVVGEASKVVQGAGSDEDGGGRGGVDVEKILEKEFIGKGR